MNTKTPHFLAAGLAAMIAGGILVLPGTPARDPQGGNAEEKDRAADRQAIQKSSRDFTQAFEQGDAKAIAALWTEQGELQDAGGEIIRGRAAIEQAFTDYFKQNPKAKVEVVVESVRFPSADLAIEEGLLRQLGTGKELPTSSLYSTTHVREAGRWKIAVSREWGAEQDRLQDLKWLLGVWQAATPGQETTLSFDKDAKAPYFVGQFTKKTDGKVVASGTMKIGLDPQTGQLRSWHFDEDGGHGQALWIRDGNSWVLDCIGVTGGGADTASVNILSRINKDAFTWRSIDRVMDDEELLDTVPIKLTRVNEGKK